MKTSHLILLFSCIVYLLLPVAAQNGLPDKTPANAVFIANINIARNYEKTNKSLALAYYLKALANAQTDTEKAQAQLGIGNNTLLRPKNDDAQNENGKRVAAFQSVLDLPDANPAQKYDARLGLAQTQLLLDQYETAFGNFQTVLLGADATAEQKVTARQGSAETLLALKRYDDARNTVAANLTEAKATVSQKTAARQLIARAYLRQGNPRMAQAEMKKIASPDLKDETAAQVYLDNGAFFRSEKQQALARAAYEMIPTLANASVEANLTALLQIGATYFEEKDYAKAREVWNFIPTLRGGEKFAGNVWRSIGISYVQEKNYSAARDAFGKWREVSAADVPGQVNAWEAVASTFLEEKNYASARETLSNVGKLSANVANFYDKEQLRLRERFGVALVYRAEGNFAQATTVYSEILDTVPISNTNPSYFYDTRRQVKTAADEMAKDEKSMGAAYTLYEKWEKFYPYEFDKAQANMAMGDILVAQGKKEEAKAKYQRVMELRKNYDEYKIAQAKIDKLDGKGGA